MDRLWALAMEPASLWLFAVVLVAATVRGFTGFGAGLVFLPFGGALIGPRAAVIVMWTIDTLPTLPILLPALRHADYRSVLPAAAAAAIAVPLGAHVLTSLDPTLFRWGVSTLVLALALLLFSGLRFTGPRRPGSAFGVGLVSGFLGGATQLSGPPLVLYWMSGTETAAQVRANLIVFFAFSTVVSGLAYFANDLFTAEALMRAALAAPIYLAGILLGQRLFTLAPERLFRAVAITIIVAAAILALPVFDGALR
ncbi:sulfite exporter TauE/SafE family protein [Afifella pfennigii]|uniref:sulfite exporter TauE/SafE family protein n=1 Tax=Afifella pfennigii TaxID=209897 RepID=UPI00047D384F|nr:sulfite exporter TauE/SafE family protein [Afifella pfennigii]